LVVARARATARMRGRLRCATGSDRRSLDDKRAPRRPFVFGDGYLIHIENALHWLCSCKSRNMPAEGSLNERSRGAYAPGPRMAQIVERNIQALIARDKAKETQKHVQDRLADAITRFAGSMKFVCVHVALVTAWVVVNLGWIPGVPRFDETFVVLAMVASVEAIFLSTFVLISQNRMAAISEQRAQLDLQISLLAEHEVTRLLRIQTEIAEKLGIDLSRHSDLPELSADVAPEKVLQKMEEAAR
jgi:uncharacterized membrane protein